MTAQSVPHLPTILRQRLRVSASEIVAFCQRWHIEELGLFGSVIRNDFGPESDIDVLVVFESSHRQGDLSHIGTKDQMQDEITALFERKVDLTEKRLLKNPFSRSEILSTHRVIYPPERANFTTLLEADKSMTDSTRNNAALLNMVKAMQSLQSFTKDRSFERYVTDELLRLGIEKALEILGEAANRLTPEFQAEHVEIDWRNIVGLRNAIIHQYDEIDYETIWKIATVQVPILRKEIEPLLSPLPEE